MYLHVRLGACMEVKARKMRTRKSMTLKMKVGSTCCSCFELRGLARLVTPESVKTYTQEGQYSGQTPDTAQ